MEERYSWKEMPKDYHASYYNDIDLEKRRTFVIIDNESGKEYIFPEYERRKSFYDFFYDYEYIGVVIEPSLWNQTFFNWICSTAPDFCIKIPKEFMTPELIDICLNNTSKPNFIKEVADLTQDQCIKFVKRLPLAIKNIPKGYITKEMAIEVLNEYPDLLIHIPIELTSLELRKECYKKVSLDSKISFILKGFMENLFISDMLEQLLDDCIASKKQIDWWNIRDILSCIPESQLTIAICKKTVIINRYIIQCIPLKFQTLEVQKIAIDQDARVISSIPDDYLSNEIIKYALNKNGIALAGIPNDRKTKEFCELAMANNMKAFRYVPNQYKTYEMCKNAILFDPKLIKKVPVEILTKQFFTELQEMGVVILDKYMGYVNECLQAHDKMNQTNINFVSQNTNIQLPKTETALELKNIDINNLTVFFSTSILKQLTNYGITNLEQLFAFAMTPDFVTYFNRCAIWDEVSNTIRLLRCKYLHEDPLIDINDEQIESEELYKFLGFSTRSTHCLQRIDFCKNAKEFFEKMRNPLERVKLNRVRNLGENSLREILEKSNIVIHYYENLKEREERPKNLEKVELDDNTLESLNTELKRLQEERKRVDNRIDIVIAKIQEKILEQSKGGILK